MAKLLAIAVFASIATAPVLAADEGEVLEDLTALLPGEFDSEAMMNSEKEVGIPDDLVHGWVYRSFVPIDAPEVGENVFVSTVRYGGKEGQFDKGEFQVWTLGIDQDNGTVKMSPRRFKEPEQYIPRAGDPDVFANLNPSDLLPPEGAAGCNIYWRLQDGTLNGSTQPGACKAMSTTLDVELVWDWSFFLDDTELWVNFAGRNAEGEILSGRPDQLPWRLDRVK